MTNSFERVLMVRNPASGGANADVYREIESALSDLGRVSVCEPSSPDDLDHEVQAAAADADLVVTAGGDGTFNCTVNALHERLDELTFAVIPLGTGNDLARTFGFAGDPLEAARGLGTGTQRRLDVSRASGAGVNRLFVNACIGGFPVEVDEELNEKLKKMLGPLAFVIGGIKAFPDLDRSQVAINGEQVSECIAVGIGNGRTCGGGVEVWPRAEPDDGDLDGAALCASSLSQALLLAAKVRRGGHEDLEGVLTTRAKKLSVTADPPIEFNVDGELIGLKSPATFEVVARLRLLVPSIPA